MLVKKKYCKANARLIRLMGLDVCLAVCLTVDLAAGLTECLAVALPLGLAVNLVVYLVVSLAVSYFAILELLHQIYFEYLHERRVFFLQYKNSFVICLFDFV